jgi:bile acid:Na+ symporter, BASS family
MVGIIVFALNASIVLTVLAIGLNATFSDAIYLFRRPAKLFKSILSMNVVMLVTAIIMVNLFNLHPAVKIALVALSISPVPPVLPRKAHKAHGAEPYTIGLLVAAASLAIVLIPLSLELLKRVFHVSLEMPVPSIAKAVLATVLGPLLLGIVIRLVFPALAEKIVKPMSLLGLVMLLLSALPLLIFSFPAVWSLVGNGSVIALAAFALIGLLAGHLLGGPAPKDRVVLALCTASRHPGIAIAIAHANFADQKLTAPAIILFLFVSSIVSVPYVQWARRRGEVLSPNTGEFQQTSPSEVSSRHV